VIPVGWSGTVTPTKAGHLFSPTSRSYTNVTNHINGSNFATAATHAVSGTITRDGLALSGVSVAGSNGASCTSTNASGQYTCAVLPGWSGTVTPTYAGHVLTPASRSYTNVTAAQPSQGYIAQAAFYQVSGSVTLNGLPLANVALAATGGPTCSSTNGAGQYSCTVPLGWTGSVTPSASGYSFGPVNRSYSNVAANQSAQTFTASLDTATAPLYFVHVDHLNTPRLVSNSAQQAVWRWDQQEPFGTSPADENPSSLGAFEFPLRFPGQYADKETNLFYNYFRDYDPGTGRYTQSDPIGLRGGINTYSYVGGNSIGWIDPSGLEAWPATNKWNAGQASAYADFMVQFVQTYNQKIDCADLALLGLMRFAEQNQLPVKLKYWNRGWKLYDSTSEAFSSGAQFQSMVLLNLGALNVIDNTIPVTPLALQAGDLLMTKYNQQLGHTRVVVAKSCECSNPNVTWYQGTLPPVIPERRSGVLSDVLMQGDKLPPAQVPRRWDFNAWN
jgi:RHS repeat-associated protein